MELWNDFILFIFETISTIKHESIKLTNVQKVFFCQQKNRFFIVTSS